jgi:hypothetical protein
VTEFLLLEGRPGDEIAIRLHNISEEAADSRATAFRWITTICRGNPELQSDKPPERPSRYETDEDICDILRDNPFASLRTIAEMLGICPETVRLHLLRIGYVLKALHWVPYILTEDLTFIDLKMCQTMLAALRRRNIYRQCSGILTDSRS